MYSNLSALSSILLSSAHWNTTSRSVFRFSVSVGDVIWPPILVSSAKLERKTWLTFRSMSPIRTRYNNGPSTEPRGTPDLTGDGSDLTLFTSTDCVLCVRKRCIHRPIFPEIPKELSFLSVIMKSTLSNAFAKSKYTTSTQSSFSMSSRMWS